AIPAADRAEDQACPGAIAGRDAALEVLGAECNVATACAAHQPGLDHTRRLAHRRGLVASSAWLSRPRPRWRLARRPTRAPIVGTRVFRRRRSGGPADGGRA